MVWKLKTAGVAALCAGLVCAAPGCGSEQAPDGAPRSDTSEPGGGVPEGPGVSERAPGAVDPAGSGGGAFVGTDAEDGEGSPAPDETQAASAGASGDGSPDPETGVWSGWLDNGIRVHHRRMSEGEGVVAIQVTLADGLLRDGPGQRGISEGAVLGLRFPWIGEQEWSEVSSRLRAEGVALGATALPDRVQVRSEVASEGLGTALGWIATVLTEGRVDENVFERWLNGRRAQIEAVDRNGDALATREAFRRLAGDDARWLRGAGLLEVEDADSLSLESVSSRLGEIVGSPMEVAIVGDVGLDEALALAREHLGALPGRARIAASMRPESGASPRTGVARFEIGQMDPEVLVRMEQLVPGDVSVEDRVALDLGTGLLWWLADRELRANRQLADRIDAGLTMHHFALGRPMVWLRVEALDGAAEELVGELNRIASSLMRGEIPQDVLETERARMLEEVQRMSEDRRAWTGALSTLTYYGGLADSTSAGGLGLLTRGEALVRSLDARAVSRALNERISVDRWVTVIVERAGGRGLSEPRWWMKPVPVEPVDPSE